MLNYVLVMLKACVELVNVRKGLVCIHSKAMHMASINHKTTSAQTTGFTQTSAPRNTIFYTSYTQKFSVVQSVNELVVHILHSAYKENYKLNKGTI